MKASFDGVIVRPYRAAVMAMVKREARAWRSVMGRVQFRLTPLDRALLMPAREQRKRIEVSRRSLRVASDTIGLALQLGADGHAAAARTLIGMALPHMRAASLSLGLLFEDWRAQ